MKTKRCSRCEKIKSVNEFYRRKDKNKYRSECKKCSSEQNKKYREKNLEKMRENDKRYRENNPKKIKERYRKWREKNPEYGKEHYQNNLEYYKGKARMQTKNNPEYNKEWKKNNPKRYRKAQRKANKKFYSIPKNRLSSNISTLIYYSLKGNKKSNHWEDLVGYTLQDLMAHLENQFKEDMKWNNYGKWHIDHILPISSFNFNSYENKEFKQCWALKNLQPLWASENKSKGAKI